MNASRRKIEGFSVTEDLPYLERIFIPKGLSIFGDLRGGVEVDCSRFAGVIELPSGARIKLKSKVPVNLFYLLSFLKSDKGLTFDREKSIEVRNGECFFDALGHIFLNELEAILDRGILKSYVEKEEDLRFIKGRMLHGDQIAKNKVMNPKIWCRYQDLTCDNLENQIILRATSLIIGMIRFNEELREELHRVEKCLVEEVSMDFGLSARDCDRVCLDRLNQHYEMAIELSRLILEENFIRSTEKGQSRGFNFIINMNKVYEDFITTLIEEVIESEFPKYTIQSQPKFDLVDDGSHKVKPDVVIKKRNSDEFPVIIDAKYKKEETNSDFYQMVAYSLAIPSSKICCLIYPESDDMVGIRTCAISRNLETGYNNSIAVQIRAVKIVENEGERFRDFINRTKREVIAPMLKELLHESST